MNGMKYTLERYVEPIVQIAPLIIVTNGDPFRPIVMKILQEDLLDPDALDYNIWRPM
jgi:hypothetical protein